MAENKIKTTVNMSYKHSQLTTTIINAFYKVDNPMGYGFMEKVYEKALIHELGKHNLRVKDHYPIAVYCDGVLVGHYVADIVIDDEVIFEIKAVETIQMTHEVPLVNYLQATGNEIGLLLNFGQSHK